MSPSDPKPVISEARSATSASAHPAASDALLPLRAIPWILLGILGIAAALRLYHLATLPFDEDELYTLHDATNLTFGASRGTPGITGRPVYYILQHILLSLHQPTLLYMRLPPFLFGLAGVWATWALGRRVFGNVAAAVAGVLAAVAPWLLYESQFARYWTLLYLLFTLTLLLLLRATAEDRPPLYSATLALILIGVFTHPTFVFPLSGVVFGLFLVDRNGRIGLAWPTRSAWRYLWVPAMAVVAGGWYVVSAVHGPEGLRNYGSRGLAATVTLLPAILQWAGPVLVSSGVVGSAALFLMRCTARDRRWAALATGAGVFTMLILLTASLRTAVYADYATPLLAVLFVTIGGVVQRVAEQLHRGGRWFILGVTALLAATVAPEVVSHLSDGTRFDYRPSYDYARTNGKDRLLVGSPVVLVRYYAPDLPSRELPANLDSLTQWLNAAGTLWVIAPYHRNGLVGGGATLERWLFAHCRQVLRTERPRFDYRMYRVDLYACAAAPPLATRRSGAGLP